MSTLLDSLLEGYLTGDREGGMEGKRAPLEMYAFLLQWFVSAAKKVKAPSASTATDDRDASPVATTVGLLL
jgi:hypothetical protein